MCHLERDSLSIFLYRYIVILQYWNGMLNMSNRKYSYRIIEIDLTV